MRWSSAWAKFRSRGVIVDVTALDVMDSFASRTLRDIAHMIRLRGAETVIVGIQPEVAFAMVQLGLTLEGVTTALDLEEDSLSSTRNHGKRSGTVRDEMCLDRSDVDIVTARQKGVAGPSWISRSLAVIATAISELARNIVIYAKRGEIRL